MGQALSELIVKMQREEMGLSTITGTYLVFQRLILNILLIFSQLKLPTLLNIVQRLSQQGQQRGNAVRPSLKLVYNRLLTNFEDYTHVNGGLLTRQLCDVQFHILIPTDQESLPYIALRSIGVHKHPPPPPSKTPHHLVQDLYKLISRGDVLNMTRSK